MNISIFGLGYVGCVSLGCLAQNGHQVTGVDVDITKVGQINQGRATIVERDISTIIAEQFERGRIRATTDYRQAILDSDVSIVAVGTPSTAKGHLNLRYIFNVADHFAEVLREKEAFHVIAIRSTVMPGTCDKIATLIEQKTNKLRNIDFAVVSNPEFLREGSAVRDYFHPPITLIGSESQQATLLMKTIYESLPAELIVTEIQIAELMKYVNNTYHALKISFANEVGNICSAMGLDSHAVMDIFCKDNQLNISKYYFKPGFAYGGSCLPKDLKGLQMLAHDLYVSVPVINSIHQTNEIQMQRAMGTLMQYVHKRIGFLGLGFKAGTDDLRNSPAVSLAESLLGKGCSLMIYDRNINLSKLTGTNKAFIDRHIPHLSQLLATSGRELMESCDVLVICTPEAEFADLVMSANNKVVVDLVRLPKLPNPSNDYIGINWSLTPVEAEVQSY